MPVAIADVIGFEPRIIWDVCAKSYQDLDVWQRAVDWAEAICLVAVESIRMHNAASYICKCSRLRQTNIAADLLLALDNWPLTTGHWPLDELPYTRRDEPEVEV